MRIFKNEKERKSASKKIFAIAVLGLLTGYIGMAAGFISVALWPLLAAGGEDKIYGKEVSPGIRSRWKGLSRNKKIAVGIAVAILLPFIAIAVMWGGIMATAYWVDMLFVIPLILIAGFLFYYKKERQTNAIGRVLGNPITGIAGVVIIGLILASTVMNYWEENKYVDKDIADLGTPLTTDSSDYARNNTTHEVIYRTNPDGTYMLDNSGNKIPVLQSLDNLIFKVVDDFFYTINFPTNMNQTFEPATTSSTLANVSASVGLEDTDGQLEIPNARVSMTLKDNNGVDLLSLGQKTDAGGLCMFSGVPYGTYVVSVDVGGYFKFSKQVHINDVFNNQIVKIHMMPVYYRVSVTYIWSTEQEAHNKYIFAVVKTTEGSVYMQAQYEGGITRADLENLRRQQSWYGWTGMTMPSLSNEMLKMSNQIASSQLLWFIPIAIIAISSVVIATKVAGASTTTLKYKGHNMAVGDCYVMDSTGNHPAWVRQIPSANNHKVNASVESGSDMLPYSALKERKYVYALWTTHNADGNTFRAQFNVTTYYTEKVNTWFSNTKTDKTIWSNVEVTWQTELPSMSTDYWRN